MKICYNDEAGIPEHSYKAHAVTTHLILFPFLDTQICK